MQFIKMPWDIYKNDPNWVPPLIMDRKKLLDQKEESFFSTCRNGFISCT